MAGAERGRTALQELAERLRLTREAMGLKQIAMARLAGISPQAWWNYENARKRISIDHAMKVCRATGVGLNWIYRDDASDLPVELATKIQVLQAAEARPEPRRRRRA